MTTIHYVTEMVDVATGRVTQRKLWTVKAATVAADVMNAIRLGHKTNRRGGNYRCTIIKMWAA